MGACCSTECTYKGRRHGKHESEERDEKDGHGHGRHDDDNNITSIGHNGAIIRLQGSSSHTSMYSRKGKKGINQDAMTVWENFTGEKNVFFCGVFDGHGPSGHKVAHHVCEALPLKLSTVHRPQPRHGTKKESDNEDRHKQWEADFMRSFKELDQDLSMDDSLDSYCSGTTAVTLVKQDHHLIIANLGDSRAILGTRDNNNQLFPVQLTVDLKPSIPGEAERIQKNGGRVFAMEEEPNVPRVWMQDQDCPGLAMSRALGDFCLKDHGLISTPQVFHRRLASKDEFVVMATDGVWDVLSNNEVIQIVASVKRLSIAAKVLVYYAVQAWRTKYPGSKVDDCAVVCLFFKKQHHSTSASMSDISMQTASQIDIPDPDPKGKKTEEGETVINSEIVVDRKMLEEVNRANAYKRSRLGSSSRHKTSGDSSGGTQS
ncbi:putative protein phosphatase 2C 65 [Hibiscus syriacus]|uniref:PPM-type phosphatase domain-containing protein n=1 Tax=Hibiscus syriacus TaxID=106335 RepID=A0A6A2ZX58_HIBSY|nr:probable protein phosphatase 2C 65 [Hibiscus syriacus]KAE8696601.1 putative protein phosphatase 2C 65 [Hibiscus syriacus]